MRVASDAGALCACRLHIDCLYRVGDLADARLQQAIDTYWRTQARTCFTSRQQLIAFVEQLVEDNSRETCAICLRISTRGESVPQIRQARAPRLVETPRTA